jgi:Tfp pilus assembly protein PilF
MSSLPGSESGAALKQDARNNLARAYLAGVLIRMGNDEEAERELKALLASDPGDYRCRGNLAGLYRKRGKIETATAEMKEAVEAPPTCAAGWHNLEQLYGERRQWVAADAALRKSVGLDRKRPLAHFHLAFVLRVLVKTAEVDREMRIAVELDPSLARRPR